MLAETAGLEDATFVVVGLAVILGSGLLATGPPFLFGWATEHLDRWLSGRVDREIGTFAKAASVAFRCLCPVGLVTGLWIAVEYGRYAN